MRSSAPPCDQVIGERGWARVSVWSRRRPSPAPICAPLNAWLEAQPEWSDFPFILLTRRGGGIERNPAAARLLGTLGNVTFLERPFHPTTLISLAQSALRGRRRQYEARARLVALSELAQSLECQVEERTAELTAGQARLRAIFETNYQYQGLLALDGTLLDANQTSLEGIEAKAEDVINRKFWDTPWFTGTPGMPEWSARPSPRWPRAKRSGKNSNQSPGRLAKLRFRHASGRNTEGEVIGDRARGGRHHRAAPRRRSAAPIAETRGDGPADRRRRPRLQQSADADHRRSRSAQRNGVRHDASAG